MVIFRSFLYVYQRVTRSYQFITGLGEDPQLPWKTQGARALSSSGGVGMAISGDMKNFILSCELWSFKYVYIFFVYIVYVYDICIYVYEYIYI